MGKERGKNQMQATFFVSTPKVQMLRILTSEVMKFPSSVHFTDSKCRAAVVAQQ